MSASATDISEDRKKRKALMTRATMLSDNGDDVAIRVRNLSPEGLGGTTEASLKRGDAYTIDLKGIGPVRGAIAWVVGGRFGFHFDDEIELESLEMTPLAAVKITNRDGSPRYDPPEMYKRPGLNRFGR